MSDELLETYIRQLLEAHPSDEVNVAWQGGEPTLMRLDVFRRAIVHVEKYRNRADDPVHDTDERHLVERRLVQVLQAAQFSGWPQRGRPEYRLGNIQETPLRELVDSRKQRAFGQHKLSSLPKYCRECEVRFAAMVSARGTGSCRRLMESPGLITFAQATNYFSNTSIRR